ncbi:TPA: hypothetical protein DCR79_02315 [Patescibacteria group bacterium]|uniref:Uncharacterized protein n=1 Tax=Candidatus Woesebacteria bacterium GW2011_GWB1_39_10b TaxID=1618573 RepID=A0A0G0PUY1_9BACT|nr:MAG: hypothetical protein UT19_C0019G0007 [Candidatus Woesebacteria bacterium GW2011_GWB1_39_10b]HAR55096.1 hypothetical protein [Patescibacteria group bacterium]HCR42135.1 hypothetical protein [Patescibacteria group bacterium]
MNRSERKDKPGDDQQPIAPIGQESLGEALGTLQKAFVKPRLLTTINKEVSTDAETSSAASQGQKTHQPQTKVKV